MSNSPAPSRQLLVQTTTRALRPKHLVPAILLAFLLIASAPVALAKVSIQPMPDELRSSHFTVTIDGQPAPVGHAAANYYFLNFDLDRPAKVAITAPTDDYWAAGVDVQPWRLGIRPEVHGRTITFTVNGPAKLSITRPNDYQAHAEMLFLFANTPEKDPPAKDRPGIRYYGPGVYHEYIDAHSGDTIYLAPGAVVFGGLNVWDVENVKVFGRGTIVYDGPQNPSSDDGWRNQPNWHVIVMHNANKIDIRGITCIVRSRTWMIQMRDSRNVTFDNIKVIGGSAGNANQDGMDWLGGGNAHVNDVFIRAADDIFAMYGNWDGYTEEALTTPGHDVNDITIENSVLSTSISNVVRVNWPRKIFNNTNFTLRDSDVIHMGIGGCGVPFSLFEIWADPGGKGDHTGFLFQNIRMDDWYSLTQLRQPNPSIRDVKFDNIWALDSPSMVPSVLKGDVQGVSVTNFKIGSRQVTSAAEVPLDVLDGAGPATFAASKSTPSASFSIKPAVVRVGTPVIFDASASTAPAGKIAAYEWFFGDGTTASGRIVRHRFADADGTFRDGSGRFRVLLKVSDTSGNSDWSSMPAVVTSTLQLAEVIDHPAPGLTFRYYEGTWDDRPSGLPDLITLVPAAKGIAPVPDTTVRKRDQDYAVAYDGYIRIPLDGGYTFTVFSRDGGQVRIGSSIVATSPKAVPQVCGSAGNAVQSASGTVGLKAGLHPIHIIATHSTGDNDFAVRWEGPNLPSEVIPASALFANP